MIRAVLIDDEPNNIHTLQQLLELYCPLVEVIGTGDNMPSGREVITHTQPDLVFLDIEMPYGNAFELLNSLSPVSFEVIFVTAFDNYALNAIKYSALDYLLKPINIKELQGAVQKAADKVNMQSMHKRIDTLLFNLQQPRNTYQRLALPTQEGLTFIHTADCMRFESSSNYTYVHLKNKSRIVTTKALAEFEEILNKDQFTRIHRSHIVNHLFIKKYHRGRGGYIEMEDGTTIEVSTRKKDEFLAKFG